MHAVLTLGIAWVAVSIATVGCIAVIFGKVR
jgi:hypothetical protein